MKEASATPSKNRKRGAVLLISSRANDHGSMRVILQGSSLEFEGSFTGCDGLDSVRRNPQRISVVICEQILPDVDWRWVLAKLDDMHVRTSLIVLSRLADERLWAEALNSGAFDVLLSDPFEREEVLRVTESAWRASNRHHEGDMVLDDARTPKELQSTG